MIGKTGKTTVFPKNTAVAAALPSALLSVLIPELFSQKFIYLYQTPNVYAISSIFQDVVFPSITVCNLNQIEASFLKELEEVNIFHPFKFFKTMAKVIYTKYSNETNTFMGLGRAGRFGHS